MNIRTVLLTGCAIAAFASTRAQAADSDVVQAPDGDAVQADAASDSGDIVVTAPRREESIQDVPAAISAFSGETLESAGVQEVADLGMVAPGLGVTATATGGKSRPVYELRGINPGDVLSGQDQSVGIYYNDIYLARPIGTNQSLFDIESVQVLYGPQGTLFGRNTPAGAILISTKKPTNNFEGEVWAGYGNYNDFELGAIVNVPLSDKIQLRLGGQRQKRDGFTLNILNGQRLDDENNYALRGSLRIQPTDSIENITVVDYFHSDNNFLSGTLEILALPGQTVTLADGNIIPLATTFNATYPTLAAEVAAQLARGPRQVRSEVFSSAKDVSWGVANTTTYELSDSLTIKNILGYRENKNDVATDTDRSGIAGLTSVVDVDQHQFSEELQLQGKAFDNKLTYILGGFYFSENGFDRSLPTRNLIGTTGFTATTTVFQGLTKSKSLFAQGTYAVLDNLNFTAGLRYNKDDRTGRYLNPRLIERGNPIVQVGSCTLANTPANPVTGAPAEIDVDGDCRYENKVSYKRATYTLTLDYKPVDELLVYVSHRKGYRAGGFNGRGTNRVTTTPFAPEGVKDFEFGAKADFPLGGDARLTADFAGFNTKYDDLQRSVVVINPTTGQPTTSIINAAKATIKGFEVKVNLRVMRGLTFGGSWAHNNARYDRFEGVRACPKTIAVPCTAALRQILTATDLPFGTAKDTVNGNLVLTPIDAPETGKVTFTGSYSYRSSSFLQNDLPALIAPLPSRSLVNMSLAWEDIAGSRFSAEASVRNLFDKTYRESGLSTLTSLGFGVYYYGDPRTYGLTLRYRFGD